MRGQQSAISNRHRPRPRPRSTSPSIPGPPHQSGGGTSSPWSHARLHADSVQQRSRLVLAQLQLHQRRLAREQLQRARGVWLQKNGLQPALQPWAFSTLLTAAPSGERPVGLCNAQNPHAPLSNSFALESGGAFRRPWSRARRRAALRCTKHQQHLHPQHAAARSSSTAAEPTRLGLTRRRCRATRALRWPLADVQHARCSST